MKKIFTVILIALSISMLGQSKYKNKSRVKPKTSQNKLNPTKYFYFTFSSFSSSSDGFTSVREGYIKIYALFNYHDKDEYNVKSCIQREYKEKYGESVYLKKVDSFDRELIDMLWNGQEGYPSDFFECDHNPYWGG